MKIGSTKSRRVLYLALLLLLTVLYWQHEPFRSAVTRIVFLFTAGSRELLTGDLRSGPFRPLRFAALMALEAAIPTFPYEPLTFAGLRVFGPVVAVILGILGRTLGAWLAFDIARVFLSGLLEELWGRLKVRDPLDNLRSSGPGALLLRLLPLPFEAMSYLAGALSFHPWRYLGSSFLWIAGTTAVTAAKGGYFSPAQERLFWILRIILSLLLIILSYYSAKGKSK